MSKKKVKLVTSALISTVLLAGVVQANSLLTKVTATVSEEISIDWNGQRYTPREDDGTNVHPLVYKGRTYLPIRFITEKAGINTEWNNESKIVVLNQDLNNKANDNATNKNRELEKQVESLQKENNTLKSQNKDADYTKQIKSLQTENSRLKNEMQALKDKNNKLQEIEKQQKINSKQEADKQKAIDKKLEEQERLKQQARDREIQKQETQRKLDELRKQNNNYGQSITGQGETTQGTVRPSNRENGGWYVDSNGQMKWKSY